MSVVELRVEGLKNNLEKNILKMMKKINLSDLEIREKELRAKIAEEEDKLEKLSTERKKIEARVRLDKETSEAYDRYFQAVGRKTI